MTTVPIPRRPRPAAPPLPASDLAVPAPPALPTNTASRWHQALLAVPMLAGTVATAMMFAGHDGGAYTYLVGGIFGLSSLGMLATAFSGAGRAQRADTEAVRRGYLRQLDEARDQVRDAAFAQRVALEFRHPRARALWSFVDTARVWERRADDADFGVVRLGTGPQPPVAALLSAQTSAADELEPASVAALERFVDAHALIPDLPVAATLLRFRRVRMTGPGAADLVRAVVASLSFFHAPADIAIAVCAARTRRHRWEYVKWLPHARHPVHLDAAGPVRLFADTPADLVTMLDGVSARVVVIADGVDVGDGHADCVIEVGGSAPDHARPETIDAGDIAIVVAADGSMTTDGGGGPVDAGVAESLSRVEAETLARLLAPLRLAGDPGSGAVPGRGGFTELIGVGEAERYDAARAWREAAGGLRVPIGTASDGSAVVLDLNESALDGMGPHGLVIGATGSGKSELLRALVLGLAATHDSAALNFVLIDFKGGATFATLDRLPHTAAVITNLANELPLVDRMADALQGELVRRQELLRAAGNLASVREYERLRTAGRPLDPIPALLVVCDEFSELLTAKPEFIDLFIAMGRLGRSLDVHLLLASQRLDEGRLRGLETHLSYRIGLRTFSAIESRAVLGVADAYQLPREPGHGYLRFGTEPLVRFKAAYVSGPALGGAVATGTSADTRIVPFTSTRVGVPAAAAPEAAAGPALIDVLVDRLADAGDAAHRIWLPPLGRPEPLDLLIGPVSVTADRGLMTVDQRGWGRLRVPVGVLDRPFQQRREALMLDLDGAAGHVAIVGGPQSGKSAALRTLITTLALTHTPREATFYCLDFGGGGLRELHGLPHVGALLDRHDAAAVRRCVGEIATILSERERRFATDGVGGIGSARGTPALHPYGDLFLVIDGWATIRSDYDELEAAVTDIAGRGLSYGVHVIITATRWADLRPGLRDLLTSRLELRLGDAAESIAGRKLAAQVPDRAPGRGITADGGHFLVMAPRLSSGGKAASAIAAAWPGSAAPPVRELPSLVPMAQLKDSGATGLRIPIGIAEADLAPVSLDFATDPHLFVFGDVGCGKSAVLRTLATAITERFTPDEARIVVIDYRRSLLGEFPSEHLIGYASSVGPAAELLGSVAAYMRARLPGPDVTPAQLKARSWFTGPECFVLVDDWDLVAGAGNPVAALTDLLAHARDIGLHLIVARRTGGASRALYEPVLARLRELTTPGLIMSGDREEGALVGSVRPRPLPPGRGYLVDRRDDARLIQVGYAEPVA